MLFIIMSLSIMLFSNLSLLAMGQDEELIITEDSPQEQALNNLQISKQFTWLSIAASLGLLTWEAYNEISYDNPGGFFKVLLCVFNFGVNVHALEFIKKTKENLMNS